MPLCGFNQKMLEGLSAFQEGLVEHGLVERARIRSQSVDETLQRELIDMDRFLGEISNLADPDVRELTKALINYANAFYKVISRKGVDNYQQTIRTLNEFYAEMDRKFYQDLEGKPDDMKQLVRHLNEVSV